MENIALLGFGRIGKKFYDSSLKSKKIVIKNILRKKLINSRDKKVNFFTNFNSLIKNKSIKGYIIATPVQSHFEYAKKIIKNKKPLIIEKPLVSNLFQLKTLYKLCKNYKKSIFVNHKDLYNPAFIKFTHELKLIGKYNKIYITFGKSQKIKKFKLNKDRDFFFPSFEWLPHPLAIAIKLKGYPHKISVIKNKITFSKKYIFQKSIICLFYKKKIIQINFSNNYKIPKRKIKVIGKKDSIIYDGYKKKMLIKKSYNKNPKEIKYQKSDPFDVLINKFCLSINKKIYKNDIPLSYKVMKILFKIEALMKNKLNL